MTIRSIIRAAGGAVLSLWTPIMAAQAANQPNVVIIFNDDLGYGDVSCYGQTTYETPHIDKLAEEGVRLTDFYVPVPYCGPSRGAMLTGRFPLRNGMVENPNPEKGDEIGLNADEITLGEIYQDNGYRTAVIGKWHLGHREEFYPTRHGFDEYYGILYSNDMRPVQIMQDEAVVEYPVDQRYLTKKYTHRAISFIERNQSEPFFLYLAHAMPHKPLGVSDEFYTPETPGDLYHDVVRELDWSVGEVIDALERTGQLDNTIVIFTSDNGPHFGGSTGGLKGKKATPWEGGIRVPFIIRYPSEFKSGATVSSPAWSIDLFPTLLALTGMQLPGDVTYDGEDIRDVLKGMRQRHTPIYSAQNTQIITIRDGDWKLYVNKPRYLNVRDLDPIWVDPKWPDGETIISQTEQPSSMQYPGIVPEKFPNDRPLFNLAEDPTESKDLAGQRPDVVRRLTTKYKAFLASMPDSQQYTISK